MSEMLNDPEKFSSCCDLCGDISSETKSSAPAQDKILLERGGFFRCPAVKSVTPSTIPAGYEYVEILASGRIFFKEENETDEKEYPRGTVFWHSAGEKTICHTDPKDPYRCYVLVFKVPPGWKRPGPRVSYWGSEESVLDFASECAEAVRETNNRDLLSQYAYSTLRWKACSQKAHTVTHLYPVSLQKAMEFVSKNPSISFSVEALAHAAGVSRATLFTLFRTYLGMPPHSWLLARKMEKAKNLLAGELLPIKEVAEKCGFESIEVFYRCFRRICGVTPAQYRKRYSVYPDKVI